MYIYELPSHLRINEAIYQKNLKLIMSEAEYIPVTSENLYSALKSGDASVLAVILIYYDLYNGDIKLNGNNFNLSVKNLNIDTLIKYSDVIYQYKDKISDYSIVKNLFFKLGQYDRVIEIFNNGRFTSNKNSQFDIANAYIAKKDFEQAFNVYKRLEARTENAFELSYIKREILKAELLQKNYDPNISNKASPQINTKWIESKLFIEDIDLGMIDVSKNVIFSMLLMLPLYVIKKIQNVIYGHQDEDEFLVSSQACVSAIESLSELSDLKEVLDIRALSMLKNDNINTLILNNFFINDKGNFVGGELSPDNDEIYVARTAKSMFKGRLIHELGHSAINNVFNNDVKPYKINDQVSEHAYNMAITQCLKNFYKALYKTESPDFENRFEFGKKLAQGYFDNSMYGYIKKTIQSNFGDQAVEFLDGLVDIYYTEFYDIKEYVAIKNFLNVYQCYDADNEHAEFIVRYEELVASGFDNNSLKTLQPLKDYIDKFVKPEMQDFIATHEYNHLLLCPREKYIDQIEEDSFVNEALHDNYTNSTAGHILEFCY